MTAVATLPRDVMVGMLRKGETGNDILNILNVIVPDNDEVADAHDVEFNREQACEDLGIADCPENDDEIARYMESAAVWV